MYIPNWPSATELLPTMYDLPSEDPEEPGLPDEFHLWQPRLLCDTCHPPNFPNDRVFVASDLNLYYDSQHFNWYKRPDWFVVVGASKLHQERELRLSYVMWQEGVSPMVVVELISPGTEDEDLGMTRSQAHQPPTKWEVYEQIVRIPYYVVFNRYSDDRLRVFQLGNNGYEEQNLTNGRFWIPELELGLGLWLGSYNDCRRQWLRWYDADGHWLPTSEERADVAIFQAEAERMAKESAIEQAEAERMAKESAIFQAEAERIAKEAERMAKESAIEQAEAERMAKETERMAKEAAIEQAEAERIAKESAIERAALLAEKLRAMGINPDEL